MPESVLTKKIGPFTGGIWLLVIGGGVGLALILRKGFGGGQAATMPIVVETVPLKRETAPVGGPVDGPIGGPPKKPDGSVVSRPPVPLPPVTKPLPPKPPVPLPPVTKPLPPKPPRAVRPIIITFAVTPQAITLGQSFTILWATSGSEKVVLKRPAGDQDVARSGTAIAKPGKTGQLSYTLTATNSAGSTTKTTTVTVRPSGGGAAKKDIPGGFSGTCPTTGPIPPDYQQRKAQGIARYQERRTKTGWALFNLGYGGDINGINVWLSNPLNYAVLNRVRDTRGLRALTVDEINTMRADVAAVVQSINGKENKLSNEQIMRLWEKWNTPFLCANSPRNTQTRVT